MHAEVVGRFARAALEAGEGEVCALFQRSFYVRCAGERYACIGESSLGKGPLNLLVSDFASPRLGERFSAALDGVATWTPPAAPARKDLPDLIRAARPPLPREGLACLISGEQNALASHAQPALDAVQSWLDGHTLADGAEALIGLGPGLTPSGDDYLGGVLVALRAVERRAHAGSLWRWLEPRLPGRTSAISAAHLAAAASGEAHEALHACLAADESSMEEALRRIDAIGHCSGWDALAGALAVLASA